jgi:hypothetical protein
MSRLVLSRRRLLLAAPAIVACTAFDRNGWAQDTKWDEDIQRGEVVVRLRPGATTQQILPILLRHDAMLGRSFAPIVPRDWHVYCRHDREADLARELEASGFVEFVHPVPRVAPMAIPNDPAYSTEAFFSAINAPAVWDMYKLVNFSSVPPVIDLDTGVRGTFSGGVFTPTHLDLLSPATITQVYNAEDGTQNVTDATGHGTAVYGLMAATAINAIGITSIGWGGPGIVVKGVTFSGQMNAFNWILTNVTPPAFIAYPWVFGSWAGQSFEDAVVALYNAGFLIVGATGDSGGSTCLPGLGDIPSPYCLNATACAVGAVGTPVFSRASYANYGPAAHAGGQGTTVCAPGGNLDASPLDFVSTLSISGGTNNYGNGSEGTSYAAPIVVGIARFLQAIAPWLSIGHIRSILADQTMTHSCTGFGASPIGCIDFLNVVRYVQSRAPVRVR